MTPERLRDLVAAMVAYLVATIFVCTGLCIIAFAKDNLAGGVAIGLGISSYMSSVWRALAFSAKAPE